MIVITYPLVVVSAIITRMISRDYKEQTTSREEIAALASIGTDEGLFTDKENRIIQNILRLKKYPGNGDINTPGSHGFR